MGPLFVGARRPVADRMLFLRRCVVAASPSCIGSLFSRCHLRFLTTVPGIGGLAASALPLCS